MKRTYFILLILIFLSVVLIFMSVKKYLGSESSYGGSAVSTSVSEDLNNSAVINNINDKTTKDMNADGLTFNGKPITGRYPVVCNKDDYIYATSVEKYNSIDIYNFETEISISNGAAVKYDANTQIEEDICYVLPCFTDVGDKQLPIIEYITQFDEQTENVSWYNKIKEFYIPDQYIGHAVSINLSNLESVYIGANICNPPFIVVRGENINEIVFADDYECETCPSIDSCPNLKNFDIPESVVYLPFSFLSGCDGLENIVLPENLLFVDDGCFELSDSIKKVVIPDKVYSIGKYCFFKCSSLERVVIPKSVISIGEGSFCRCPNLTLVVTEGSKAEKYAIENEIPYVYDTEGESENANDTE